MWARGGELFDRLSTCPFARLPTRLSPPPPPPRSFTVEMWARGGELFDHADIETPKTETLLSYATQQLDAGGGTGEGGEGG